MRVLGGDRIASAHHHQIRPREAQPLSAEALAHQALEAVTIHGPAGALLGDGQTQARVPFGIRPRQHGEVGIDGPAGGLEDPLKLGLTEEAVAAAEALVGRDLREVRVRAQAGIRARVLSPPARSRALGQRGVSRARPLARRACKTLRPLRVALRARKPWVLARLRRLG